MTTTLRPTVTPPQYGGEPAMIQQPEEPRVSAQEGGYVTLKCVALGTPRPIITWRKDTTLVIHVTVYFECAKQILYIREEYDRYVIIVEQLFPIV